VTINQPASRRGKKVSPFPPTILATLGVVLVLTLGYAKPGLRLLDLIVLVVAVLFCAFGYMRNLLRGVGSAVMIYLATGLAVRFYILAAPYIGSPLGEVVTRNALTLSYMVLATAFWVLFESVTKALFGDTAITWLGFLDHWLAAGVYLVIGVLIASLLFNVLGFSSWFRAQHDASPLRPLYRQVFRLIYDSHTLWFPPQTPSIYTYDLPR